MPGVIRRLEGKRFGRLLVRELAGTTRHHQALWACVCDCGAACIVRGNKLTAGVQISCGCARRDPAIRRAARFRVPARRRKAIARMGARAAQARRA